MKKIVLSLLIVLFFIFSLSLFAGESEDSTAPKTSSRIVIVGPDYLARGETGIYNLVEVREPDVFLNGFYRIWTDYRGIGYSHPVGNPATGYNQCSVTMTDSIQYDTMTLTCNFTLYNGTEVTLVKYIYVEE